MEFSRLCWSHSHLALLLYPELLLLASQHTQRPKEWSLFLSKMEVSSSHLGKIKMEDAILVSPMYQVRMKHVLLF